MFHGASLVFAREVKAPAVDYRSSGSKRLGACHNRHVSSKPLEGVLVVDLSRYLPGPLTAKMLANLGARVIKIEEPEFGDPVRSAPPMDGSAGTLAGLLLAGVESVALDLTKPQALGVVQTLLEAADVLIESFRPGKLAEFDLPPASLAERYPGLIVCSISGWGAAGPASGRAGHDLTYQAAAGALAATGEMPNLPVADLVGAFAAVSAINGALLARERTGRGTAIDSSLFDSAAIANLTNVAARSEEVGDLTPLTGAYPCYRIYDTSDGRRFALAALEPRFWQKLCASVGRPDLRRHQYRRESDSHRIVEELFLTRTGFEWRHLCRDGDVPGDLVATSSEAVRDPQMVARGLEIGGGRLPFPAILDGVRPEGAAFFPGLGEHTLSVLEEFLPETRGKSRKARRAGGIGRRLTLRQVARRWAAGRHGG